MSLKSCHLFPASAEADERQGGGDRGEFFGVNERTPGFRQQGNPLAQRFNELPPLMDMFNYTLKKTLAYL